ncbi:MAG: AAA family ATPase [Spirochaeta sp.]|jgi:predicted AAA+ superfamily ATPase|nr:AAA family ATPase [Spirochaeta sp.]
MYLERAIQLDRDLRSRSVFLFGPRQTGKTTLLRQRYPGAHWVNLLRGDEFLRFSAEPWRLRQEVSHLDRGSIVVIDEIQRLPQLLNEIHNLIEEQDLRFIITGSSPVKLRRGGVNLLGGRARVRHLSPLVFPELKTWDPDRIVSIGTLPSVYLSDDPYEDLRSYVGAYLQQEIQAEGLVRGIDGFARFLLNAGRTAGKQVVFERIASDSHVPARTIREYYGILEDTLIGRVLTPYRTRGSASRKPVSRGKFYFFDVGIAQALVGRRTISAGSAEYGDALEQYIYTELEAWCRYRHHPDPPSFWRTVDSREVDFIVPGYLAIEVKGGGSVGSGDLRGLKELREDAPDLKPVLVCTEDVPRRIDGIDVLPVPVFLERLWGDAL